jgi:two-component system cell cycle response regulator
MPAQILVIEDNPANLDLMSYLLKAFGYDVVTATNGSDGLAMARRERPLMILCDIQLPGMDGYAIVKQLKGDGELRTCPVLAVTAFAMVGDRERIQSAGFDGYISKPINPESFIPQIEAHIAPEARATPRTRDSVSDSDNRRPRGDDKKMTVLVVDNSPVDRDLLKGLLELSGYAVVLARDGDEALWLARAVRPKLIISDIEMPNVDGFAFLRSVRIDPQLQATPFILISATATEASHMITARELGANRFVMRPIEPKDLLVRIEDVLKESQTSALSTLP